METMIVAARLLRGPVGGALDGSGNGAADGVADGVAVLVRDGLIAAAGPHAEVAALAGDDARVLRYPDATVLPGLINAHVHLVLDAGDDPVGTLTGSDAAAVHAVAAANARSLLDVGVTTARDLGDRDGQVAGLRSAITAGQAAGPRLLTAGAPLTVPRGHCWFFGGEVDGERAIRELVARNAAAGADVIKVMASGGQITEGGADMWESQFGEDELRVVVDAAAEAGLPVAAHAHGTQAIVDSVAAGVHTVEHCTWMSGPGQRDQREDVAREMAARGIAACSTSSRNWRVFAEKLGHERAAAVYGRLSWLDELGVPLIFGTDAGLRGSVFDDMVGGLELYEWLGFGTERIIELATSATADALGLGGTTGRIEPGLAADLLVVHGDPVAELSTLRSVALVLAAGREHVPS